MALGDYVISQQGCEAGMMAVGQIGSHSSMSSVPSYLEDSGRRGPVEDAEAAQGSGREGGGGGSIPYLPQNVYLCDLRHDACEASASSGPAESGLVSKWRMKDRMKTGCVALVLCLNIGVDPPDVIKISPCARMECWIDPFSMSAQKALDAIGKNLQQQYERWQPRARYKLQLDPTVEEVKKLCSHCRKSAKSERVLFHYNGHGVPKPTVNGEIWLFNKSYTQYIPLSVYELESWLGTPSIYVFDCSAAGMIVNAFCERPEWGSSGSAAPAMRDCILLAACGVNESLPQNAELPADVFTSCLTTPIKIALRWFCPRSLLRDSLDPDLIDKIPGRQNDRKTPLGELNWIFTAITDTIAWNVLPRELFQRLFRQDLLVASLFRNFLLAERMMRAANCTPQSYPRLPPTHQHPMWHAWDMAAEICLAQLPALLNDPSAEFQTSPFFTEQLTAFEVWLDHGSEKKKPPEQLPIVLQVLLSQSHRFRALVLLGRFLDMGAWAVDLALSVGIFPYVLKLLQTTDTGLRQILVFIWTKILALDKSCQVDLVKDGGHQYFIKFLDSPDVYAEQRAMAAFVLAVIVDSHRRGQEACVQAGLISICLRHIQNSSNAEVQPEPLLLQWLCLCLGKLWDGFPEAQLLGFQENAPTILSQLLTEPQPEVRASATYGLGTLIDVGNESFGEGSSLEDEDEDEDRCRAEQEIAKNLLKVLRDGSPLVRAELAIGLSHLAVGHNKSLKSMAAAYLKPPSNSVLTSIPVLTSIRSPAGSYGHATQMGIPGSINHNSGLRAGSEGALAPREIHSNTGSPALPLSGATHGSPLSDGLSYVSEESRVLGNGSTSNGMCRARKTRAEESGVYVQCVAAMYALGRDPSPGVASLGQQILRSIGVEPVVINHLRSAGGAGHHRNASIGANPPTLTGLSRSFSWIDSPSGKFNLTFRTPPASPPTGQSLLSGNGMRRVCSLEFSPHMQRSTDEGLADRALVGAGTTTLSEPTMVPVSSLYSWSCGHFSRPLLEPSLEDDEEAATRRADRERFALDGISKCQHSTVTKVSDQIASWDTGSENSIRATLLHPFIPIVFAVDENEMIRIWDYEEGMLINVFGNHNCADKGVSRLCLLNELDDSLLLVASTDGSVRVWKDYTQWNKQRLATAWQSVQGHRSGAGSIHAVVDWQQITGFLYASGDVSPIMVWDLNQELVASSILSLSESSISALSASQVQSQHISAGFDDGSVRIYDIRSRDRVCATSLHKQRVVAVDFLPGMDALKIVSASQSGDIKFLDSRNTSAPYLAVDAHKGSLSAMAVHRHAPYVASGSSKQYIRVFNINGELLSTVRYHNSFLGQRIGPISCLHFHPYRVHLAAGATDSNVSIYSGDNTHSR
eukprot:c28829_g1_i1 orf=818-4927(+)